MVAMKHRARLSQAERAAFAEAIAWASMGTSAESTGYELVSARQAEGCRRRIDSRLPASGRTWDRTRDLPRVKRALSR